MYWACTQEIRGHLVVTAQGGSQLLEEMAIMCEYPMQTPVLNF